MLLFNVFSIHIYSRSISSDVNINSPHFRIAVLYWDSILTLRGQQQQQQQKKQQIFIRNIETQIYVTFIKCCCSMHGDEMDAGG